MLRKLNHKHIVRFLGTKTEEDCIYIILEFASGGSLLKVINNFGKLAENVVQNYTRQILLGLHYLHTQGVIHRDIKCANLLLDDKGCVKLSDFGCSKLFEGLDSNFNSLTGVCNSLFLDDLRN